jgi:hypothetical protein
VPSEEPGRRAEDATVPIELSSSPAEVRLRARIEGREWVVDARSPRLSLGRAPENDVVVEDDHVSRRHAELFLEDGVLTVRDLSTNGSYLVGRAGRATRVHRGSLPLAWSARLHLGWTEGTPIHLALEERGMRGGEWTLVDAGAEVADPGENTFRREGEYWTIGRAGAVFRLKDGRGLRFLAHLLEHPGREILALDLVQIVAGGALGGAGSGEGTGARLDPRARAEYRRRLSELEDALEEAERFSDVGRASLVRAEIDQISSELSSAVGLGGRDRPQAADAERARVLVTVRVREALRKIADADPELGEHFASSVKTGRYCCYQPAAGREIRWVL